MFPFVLDFLTEFLNFSLFQPIIFGFIIVAIITLFFKILLR